MTDAENQQIIEDAVDHGTDGTEIQEPAPEPYEGPPEVPGTASTEVEFDSVAAETIPVDLTFELGQKRIPLGELKNIGPGFHFRLDRDPATPVMIRAGGEVVGSGQMVRIGDRIGVRILEVFNHDDQ